MIHLMMTRRKGSNNKIHLEMMMHMMMILMNNSLLVVVEVVLVMMIDSQQTNQHLNSLGKQSNCVNPIKETPQLHNQEAAIITMKNSIKHCQRWRDIGKYLTNQKNKKNSFNSKKQRLLHCNQN